MNYLISVRFTIVYNERKLINKVFTTTITITIIIIIIITIIITIIIIFIIVIIIIYYYLLLLLSIIIIIIDEQCRKYCVRKIINICIRSLYYIFGKRNQEWNNPQLMSY